jgi:hypothetical protein
MSINYNYNNLFFDAMDSEKLKAIDEIKANKGFTLQLINDLDKIFQTNYEIVDEQNCVIIRMKRSPSNNWYRSFSFVATKEGINFNATLLDYYSHVGYLFEKYKNSGTTAEENFVKEGTSKHGNVSFRIPIYRSGDDLKQTLRDIMFIMEREQYRKRF